MNPRVLLRAFIACRGRAIASLLLIYLASFTGWYWLWGVLLLIWAFSDMLNGETWLSEIITRRHSTLLFYLIQFTWFTFGFYLVLYPFIYLLR